MYSIFEIALHKLPNEEVNCETSTVITVVVGRIVARCVVTIPAMNILNLNRKAPYFLLSAIRNCSIFRVIFDGVLSSYREQPRAIEPSDKTLGSEVRFIERPRFSKY